MGKQMQNSLGWTSLAYSAEGHRIPACPSMTGAGGQPQAKSSGRMLAAAWPRWSLITARMWPEPGPEAHIPQPAFSSRQPQADWFV